VVSPALELVAGLGGARVAGVLVERGFGSPERLHAFVLADGRQRVAHFVARDVSSLPPRDGFSSWTFAGTSASTACAPRLHRFAPP
jgi:hypothetical protein